MKARGRTLVFLLASGLALGSTTPARAAEPRIEIGYCTDNLELAKAAGFDYAELGLRNVATLGDEEFAKLVAAHKAAGLPTPTANVFLPNEIKVVGPEVDEKRQMDYVVRAFARARRLGIELIVFGSGGARRVPDGFSKDEAFGQLVAFGKRIAAEAGRQGIVVAVEPLRREETNIVNSEAEGLAWVEAVNHPSFQLIVDFYHLASGKEDPQILVKAAPHLRHVHMSNPVPNARVFPLGPDEWDYSAFFATLRQIGYHGRISIEASTKDLAADGPRAIAFLRAAMAHGVKPPAAAPATK